MKKGHLKVSVITIAVLVASMVGARTLRYRRLANLKAKVSALDTTYKAPVYDKVMLSNFKSLCQRYDNIGLNYTISGHLSVRDLADTSSTLKDVPFLCCKNGSGFYYKLGKTETINAGGFYIYVDHQAKTILLSQQKELQTSPDPKIIPDLERQLASEEYGLTLKALGGQQTYSLINEHHISCKEYSLTVDSASGKITRILTRLSNPQDPLRKDNEKIIEVDFSRWDKAADLSIYTTAAKIIHKDGNDWMPSKEYVNYQLIKM